MIKEITFKMHVVVVIRACVLEQVLQQQFVSASNSVYK